MDLSQSAVLPSPLVELNDERVRTRGVRLLLKRDDLIHPDMPGNKWRKLKPNLDAARQQGHDTLLTFGGAYSNHIRATATAGRMLGLRTIGVIRGEQRLPLNDSLQQAVNCGMELTYLDRTTYRHKAEPEVIDLVRERFGRFYLLPEGGTNPLAVRECAVLPSEITESFDIVCCACGTGGTLAGIAAGMPPGRRAMGFSALKGGDFLRDDVARLQMEAFGRTSGNWSIETDYHFGGFAKRNRELTDFIADFKARHGIEPEWVYVAKMLYGVFDLVDRGGIPSGTTVVAVVTG